MIVGNEIYIKMYLCPKIFFSIFIYAKTRKTQIEFKLFLMWSHSVHVLPFSYPNNVPLPQNFFMFTLSTIPCQQNAG